jgi:hypothetical protein
VTLASILAGAGSTHGLGEVSPSIDVAFDLDRGPVGVEGYWSNVDKVESPGWLGKAVLKANLGPAHLGIGRSHRHTEVWDKDATWARAGLSIGDLTLLVERALQSQNDETRYEGRLRLKHPSGITIEPRAFYETYKHTNSDKPGKGWGVSAMAGYSWGKKRSK